MGTDHALSMVDQPMHRHSDGALIIKVPVTKVLLRVRVPDLDGLLGPVTLFRDAKKSIILRVHGFVIVDWRDVTRRFFFARFGCRLLLIP